MKQDNIEDPRNPITRTGSHLPKQQFKNPYPPAKTKIKEELLRPKESNYEQYITTAERDILEDK